MAEEIVNIVGDVTGLQQRHHPLNKPHLVEKIEGFRLNAKSFRNIIDLFGGAPSTPLAPRWGYGFACTAFIEVVFVFCRSMSYLTPKC